MMPSDRADHTRQDGLELAAYDFPALILILGLAVITLFALFRPATLMLSHSQLLVVSISAAVFVIALGAASFALGEFLLYGTASSLFVGLAFLVFTGGSFLGLVPVVAGWTRQDVLVPSGWATENLVGATILVCAAFLVDRSVQLGRRAIYVVLGFGVALALTIALSAWEYLAYPVAASPETYRLLHLAAGLLFFVASTRFWWTSKTSNRTWFIWLALNFSIAGFAQIDFAIRQYPLGVVQFGDILRLIFFTGILLALASEWSRGYRRLRLQTRELEALHALMTVPVIQDVASVVQHIITVVGGTLEANARVLVTGHNSRYMQDPLVMQMMHLDSGGSTTYSGEEVRTIVVGLDAGPRGKAALGVPLSTADRRLGLLVVVRDTGLHFTRSDARLLRAFGAQASVLLERSLLYEEVAAGAVMQERSRLAREIHDGLAQHLAALKMRVSWLQRSPAAVDVNQLMDVEGGLETALTEARQAITTLRADPQGTSAVDAIAGYAEEFGQVSGLQVEVTRDSGVPELGAKARVEVLRVVQEALNNVRKHARATEVVVRVGERDGGTEVVVEDNGAGFLVRQSPQGHFGLEIMRERVESVRGHLTLESEPGKGTKVLIWAPPREEEADRADAGWLGVAES